MTIRVLPLLLGISAITFLVVGLLHATPNAASAATDLFPDLKTLPPTDLKFDTEEIDGSIHHVLRFTNKVWNAGEGPLELRGERESADTTAVYQRIYDDDENVTEIEVGEFVYHPAHRHWHFEDFALYELWTQAEYDAWLASGRQEGQPSRGSKVTFCLRDDIKIRTVPGTPSRKQYAKCNQELQGISVGWSDVYQYSLPNQWIDLGTSPLPKGKYVLRSVVDPENNIIESPSNDDDREGAEVNEAVTFFEIGGGSGPIPLTSGKSVSTTVKRGEFKHYYINVPAGAKILLTRTTASKDVDLYIRKAQQPTRSRWHFKKDTTSGNESTTINSSTSPRLSAGRWYISVYGYASGTSAFTLKSTITSN